MLLGTSRGYREAVSAAQRTHTDAKVGQVVHAYHAAMDGLSPGRTTCCWRCAGSIGLVESRK